MCRQIHAHDTGPARSSCYLCCLIYLIRHAVARYSRDFTTNTASISKLLCTYVAMYMGCRSLLVVRGLGLNDAQNYI
jgi:hypothetical protein